MANQMQVTGRHNMGQAENHHREARESFWLLNRLTSVRNCPHSRMWRSLSPPSATQRQQPPNATRFPCHHGGCHHSPPLCLSVALSLSLPPCLSHSEAAFQATSPQKISFMRSVIWYDICGILWPSDCPQTSILTGRALPGLGDSFATTIVAWGVISEASTR